jgi:hypothetical protein
VSIGSIRIKFKTSKFCLYSPLYCSCVYKQLRMGPNCGRSKRDRQCTVTSVTQQWGAFVQPLLQWKINIYCLFWVSVCSLRYCEYNVYVPYFRRGHTNRKGRKKEKKMGWKCVSKEIVSSFFRVFSIRTVVWTSCSETVVLNSVTANGHIPEDRNLDIQCQG